MTKFDILEKPECLVYQTGTSGFCSYEIVWYIFKQRSTLYISQVGPYMHVFHVMHVFLEQFGWISLNKQRSASNNTNMNSNWRFEASMVKASSRRSQWIYEAYDLELKRGCYDILKVLESTKTGGSDFHRSDSNLSRDFYRIWLWFSDSWKGYVQPPIYIYIYIHVMTDCNLSSTKSINQSFFYLS
jgi:hypothetical protein